MAAAGGQAARSFLTSKEKRERDQKWNAGILAYSCSLSAPVVLLGLFCHTKSVAHPDQTIVRSYYFLMVSVRAAAPLPPPCVLPGLCLVSILFDLRRALKIEFGPH